MPRATLHITSKDFGNIRLDLTQELLKGADLIAQEIRGNIKRGTNIDENAPILPNAPSTAARKLAKLGHAKPLIAEHRRLVEKSSYRISTVKRNHVKIELVKTPHPGAKISIAELGSIQQKGNRNIPPRPFFGISPTAVKRVRAFLADRISRLIKGGPIGI